MTLGQNIKRLRERAGMNQSELARMVGVSRSLISQYEADVAQPRMGMVERLSVALRCSKSEIVDDRRTEYAYISMDPGRDELLALWDNLDARGREAVLAVARSLSPSGGAVSEGVA